MDKTWSKLSRFSVIALVMTMIVLVGISLPVTTAAAETYTADQLKFKQAEFVYGDAISLQLQYQDAADNSWKDYTGYTATIDGEDANVKLNGADAKTYDVVVKSTNAADTFGDGGEVTLTVTINPKKLSATELATLVTVGDGTTNSITFDQTISKLDLTIEEKYGSVAWETGDQAPTAVSSVSEQKFKAKFDPKTDGNYALADGWDGTFDVTVTVEKAEITAISWPTEAINLTYGQKLGDVALPAASDGSFAWTQPDEMPNAGDGQQYSVKFTPDENHKLSAGLSDTNNITVNVAKQLITVTAWPTAGAITYGQKVSESALNPAADAYGTFSWADDVKDLTPDAGTAQYNVVYTLTNSNYVLDGNSNSSIKAIDLAVNKKEIDLKNYVLGAEKSNGDAIVFGDKLADVAITNATVTDPDNGNTVGNFTWNDPTGNATITAAGSQSYAVVFTLTNNNYSVTNAPAEISVYAEKMEVIPTFPELNDIYYGETIGKALDPSIVDDLGTFTVENSTIKPDVGEYSVQITYTLSEQSKANYCIGNGDYFNNDFKANKNVTIKVLKALVTPAAPSASDIYYGQTLADAKLNPTEDEHGAYSWADGADTKPEASTSPTDKRSYRVVYTLNDPDHYEIANDAVSEWNVTFYVESTELDRINIGSYATLVYDGQDHKAAIEDAAEVKLKYSDIPLTKDKDYEIAITKDGATVTEVKDAGTYTVTATGKGDKYRNSVSTTVTISKAVVSSITLNEGFQKSYYNQKEVKPTDLQATVMANEDTVILPESAYELTCNDSILTADEYTIGLTLLDNDNYVDTDKKTATYTVEKAIVSSVALNEGFQKSVYNQKEVKPTDLQATVKANEGDNEITLPAEAYTLVCGKTILTAGEYAIGLDLVDQDNYVDADKKTAAYIVEKATVSSVALNEGFQKSIYNQKEVKPTDLQATVKANEGENEITLPAEAYTLVCDKTILTAGEYAIGLELVDQDNYVDTNKKTDTYTVEKATVSSVELNEGFQKSVYSQKGVKPADLQATVKANEGENEITLPVEAYTLVCDKPILTAGEYIIGIELVDNDNYVDTDKETDIYTVEKATVASLVLGVTTRIYDQKDVDLTKLEPKVTAKANGEEITLPYEENPAYEVVFPDGTVKDADDYTLQIKLLDTQNYEGNATAEFEVRPAEVVKLELGVKTSVYDRNAVDLTKLQPVVTAVTNDDAIITLPYGDENAAYRIAGEEAVNVGKYVFSVDLVDDVNYIMPEPVTDEYTITRLKVAPLSLINNVTNSDGEYVLGGPVAAGNRTITIKGEPNEPVYVVVNGSQISDSLKLNENGIAALTVTGDGAEGKLVLGKDVEVALNGSGSGQAFTVEAVYGDENNLSDSDKDVNPDTPKANYRYDMEAQTVTVAQLLNRAESGVTVDLPEDLAEIAFTSNSGAGVAFSGSAQNLILGEGKIIAFNGTNKLHSTEFDPESIYDVTYTDLVGNTGAVLGQTVAKASGTLKIDAVEPALNANKRIGQTGSIAWTITCTSTGGNDEDVRLTIGGASFTGTLKQGSNTFVVNAGALATDRLLNVSIGFEDLQGAGTFESFVYDDRCDEPVLTSELYAECYVITGIVEPGAHVRIRVNGENVSCKVDSFGVFAANMPVVYEGDKVEIIVTDLADNVTVTTVIVGGEKDTVRMKSYMLGKLFTNAHDAKNGEALDWTSITTITEEELLAGKVKLPIVAGNMVQVGTMTMTMDENGGISYDYELNDGVALVSEDVRVNTSRSKDDAMNHTGVLLSRDSATKVNVKKGQYYVTAEFVVDVPTDQLTSTFQLLSVAESDLKLNYRDRQNNKPLK